MARFRIQGTALRQIGRSIQVAPGAEVLVKDPNGDDVSPYRDTETEVRLGSPVIVGSDGAYDFYVDVDVAYYDLEISTTDRVVDQRIYVSISDADVTDLAADVVAVDAKVEVDRGTMLAFAVSEPAEDGTLDDGPLFEVAAQAAIDGGYELRLKMGAIYRFASDVSVSVPAGKSFRLNMNGAKIILDEAALEIFGPSASILTTTPTADVSRGDSKIALSSVTGVSVGQMMYVISPALTQQNQTVEQIYVVTAIDGLDVYIDGTFQSDVTAQQIIDDGQTGAISVSFYEPAERIKVENGTFQVVDPNANGSGLAIRYARYVTVLGSQFQGSTRAHLNVQFYGYLSVTDSGFGEHGYTTGDNLYVNEASAPAAQSFGYGVLAFRGYRAILTDCKAGKGWHMVDFSRGAMIGIVDGCHMARNAYGVSCHEGAGLVIVRNCDFDGGMGVNGTRCHYLHVVNNRFSGMLSHAIAYSCELMEVIIRDNIFDYRQDRHTAGASAVRKADDNTPKAGARSAGFGRLFELSGNRIFANNIQVRVDSGFSNAGDEGSLIVTENRFRGPALLNDVRALASTEISENYFTFTSQIAATITLTADGGRLLLISNHYTGAAVGGVSALFLINGDATGTVTTDVIGNTANLDYILRFSGSGQAIRNCLRNVNSGGRIVLGDSTQTVTNAIFNAHKLTLGFNVTITKSALNEVLS